MRVSLLFNPSAGAGDGTLHQILDALAQHGHQVVSLIDSKAEAERLLERPCDLLVAAGGDGTVALAAPAAARLGVPMAILPTGNANNIALTFGIQAPLADVIQGWNVERFRPLDLGIARGSWGTRLFVESVGVGLVSAGIAEADWGTGKEAKDGLTSLARTAQLYRVALNRLRPERCTVRVDGNQVAGEFLLIEVLNIPFVGPNLVFAADANPSDGCLSIAVAGPDQRTQLDDYLRHRLEGTDCPVTLKRYEGRRIEIENPRCVHVDDQVYKFESRTTVSIEIKSKAVSVLI